MTFKDFGDVREYYGVRYELTGKKTKWRTIEEWKSLFGVDDLEWFFIEMFFNRSFSIEKRTLIKKSRYVEQCRWTKSG
jgi:hypothetical protein